MDVADVEEDSSRASNEKNQDAQHKEVPTTGHIRSFEEMYAALAAKLTNISDIGSMAKTVSDQMSVLEESRRQDRVSMTKLVEEIESLRRDSTTTTPNATCEPIARIQSDGIRSIETNEHSLKARMLIPNVDKPPQFSGEDSTDAAVWLQDFVDRSNLVGASDDFRLKVAPMNFHGVAKMWYVNFKDQLNNWQTFTEQFLAYFCPDDSRRERLGEKLYTRRQNLNESALHYYDNVMRLCSKFDAKMSNVDRVDILMKGVRPEARDWIELRHPVTPADFLRWSSEYERRNSREIENVDGMNTNNQFNDQHVQQQRQPYQPNQSVFQKNNSGRDYSSRPNYHHRYQGNEQ